LETVFGAYFQRPALLLSSFQMAYQNCVFVSLVVVVAGKVEAELVAVAVATRMASLV
jgi:hypothetical protein